VVARFEVKVEPAQQVESLIARLGDPDFAQRKAAIEALARQPAAALPALKEARPKADDSTRWWIDAAIQQIERESKRSATP